MKKRKRELSKHRERMKMLALENDLCALDILFGAKIDPRRDKPAKVAKYFHELLLLSPPVGARQLCKTIERRWGEQKFVANMLQSLGDRLYDGRETFDQIDRRAAEILAHDPAIPQSEWIDELKTSFPDLESDDPDDLFKKRINRLLENIRPSAWLTYRILKEARGQK